MYIVYIIYSSLCREVVKGKVKCNCVQLVIHCHRMNEGKRGKVGILLIFHQHWSQVKWSFHCLKITSKRFSYSYRYFPCSRSSSHCLAVDSYCSEEMAYLSSLRFSFTSNSVWRLKAVSFEGAALMNLSFAPDMYSNGGLLSKWNQQIYTYEAMQ